MWLDPELLRAVDNIRMRGSTARVHYALDALPKFVSGGREVSRDALGGTLVLAPSVRRWSARMTPPSSVRCPRLRRSA